MRTSLELAVGCGFVYVLIAGGYEFRFRPSWAPHHVLIADAFLHGQLHVRDERVRVMRDRGLIQAQARLAEMQRQTGETLSPPERDEYVNRFLRDKVFHDWTCVEGKLYGYWAPLTAVAMMPFVALFGPEVSDPLITALFGGLNVGLFYWLLRRVDQAGLSRTTEPCRVGLTLLFAFGTVHFYSACMGQVWFTAQVVTLTAVLAAALAAAAPAHRWWHTLLAGVFFGAAILGRNVAGLLIGFFPVLIWARARGTTSARIRESLGRAALFAAPCAVTVAVQGWYNYARFGDVFDTGLAAQIRTTGNPRFVEDFDHYGEFNLHFVPRNLKYYFWNMDVGVHDGKLAFDPEGHSLFMVTPPLLYIFLLRRRWSGFTAALLGGVVPFIAVLLCYFATGWYQFGNRYLLEALPLLLLLAAAGMKGRLTHIGYGLMVAAIALNWAGTSWFGEQFLGPMPAGVFWGVPIVLVVVASLARIGTARRRRAVGTGVD